MTSAPTPSPSSPAANGHSQAGESSTSPLPIPWVERLFERLSGYYGAKFGELWRGCDLASVKRVWAEALAGYTPVELKRGLGSCLTRIYPPTLPEFLLLCRPVLDPEAAYHEAVEQTRIRHSSGQDHWTDAAVYWAAARIGGDLQTHGYPALKARWLSALAQAQRQVAEGILPAQVPVRVPELAGAAHWSPEQRCRNLMRLKRVIAGLPESHQTAGEDHSKTIVA